MYSTQLNHAGRFSLFLKKPEHKRRGMTIAGVITETDFASVMMLPNISPREAPLKLMRYYSR